MFITMQDDLRYLENKYHRTDEPFNAYNRMAYHGYEYNKTTGYNDTEMASALKELSVQLKGTPHPVAKAKAFAFVLDHMRIDINEHDYFVGLYNWNRPLSPDFVEKWDREIFDSLGDKNLLKDQFSRSGAVDIWADFDHVIPNWDSLLSLGFKGLLERAREYREMHRSNGTLDQKMSAFFDGIEISYSAVIRLTERLYEYALTKHHAKARLQAECLKHISDGVPTSTYEALQEMYLFFMLCECVDHFQTRSLGNGIDSTLYPFYKADIESGRFTREQINEFIAYFLMQFSAIGNYWGHPMYIGGTDINGNTKINALSYDILDTYRELGIYNPKIQIKVNTNTPDKFLNKSLDMVRNGNSSIVFCCEPGIITAVMGYGASYREAVNFEISGCYETRVRSDETSSCVGYVNPLKAVSFAIHNGYDIMTGQQVGIRTGETDTLSTFEDFYYAFIKQLNYLIESTIRIGNAYEKYFDIINPSNLFSGTMERSLQRGVDGYAFGQKFNNSCILCCGIASAVDAIMAVKEFVYDRQELTLTELKEILDSNWNNHEKLRMRIQNSKHKYGNSDPETDRYAAAIAAVFSSTVNNRPNARGGVYKSIMHSAMEFVWQGQKVEATPDGRKKGDEESKNASPAPGMDRCGVTALIHSATVLNPCSFMESFCLDVMLHPSATTGDDGLAALKGLLTTYMMNDGMSIQFNIFDVETLRDAQKNPEKYRNLQVRVCGWNVLWNNLSLSEQESYIRRAENIR